MLSYGRLILVGSALPRCYYSVVQNIPLTTADDDKYSAHSGLVGRPVLSNSDIKAVDKALSNPKALIEDLAGSNGQNCFAYKGKCVNLNDNSAMQQACGSGFTPVGWDDAGCGKKNCVGYSSSTLISDS